MDRRTSRSWHVHGHLKRWWPFLVVAFAVSASDRLHAQAQNPNQIVDPSLFQALEYRLVGPFRGGRVTAVAGIVEQPHTYYMGSTGGGVWKTNDGGETWTNVSDGFFNVGSMGALEVADSDPNVVYAGTGSACIRGNISIGKGIYKSSDAGLTWEHIGLPNAGQIGRIQVHPDDPDLVYVAALGNPFGKNPERGVYRSADGGETWEPVLSVSDSVGAVDLSMDPTNPRILYAAMWRAERKPWTLKSGCGPDCGNGVWKSVDGGDTWTKLTNGLPPGPTGRIGVSASPASPNRVYALVEALRGEAGLYRSDDAGASWELVNEDEDLVTRPWYYNHVYADPVDEHTVYVVSDEFWRSTDAGENFTEVDTPHGDNHDLWINPSDNRIMIEGNDGGANVTFNGARTWSDQTNQPTAEFYSLAVDSAFPYRIYGPQQDNSTISVPSRSKGSAITIQDWMTVGGCETGPIAIDPRNSGVIYAGCYAGRLTRFDSQTEQERQIADYPVSQLGTPPEELRYRFQWNAPILVSRHHQGVLYHASQYVHRSTNEGQSWEVISPDLTRNDATKLGMAGDPITRDMTGVEVYSAIFALAEDEHDPGVLWAGSNDGLIHISHDRGETWTNVTPEGIPAWSTVSVIEPSPHAAGRAFVAVYRYRVDDWAPYIFRTDDFGETWTRIAQGTNGIPEGHPVRVVREDPNRRGLLYAGTEFGLFVSFDDGAHWQSLQLNLPRTPVTDLALRRHDLVVSTQGRSFWVLDDVTPLHEITAELANAELHLFSPRETYRTEFGRADEDDAYPRDAVGGARLKRQTVANNPPAGALIFYYMNGEVDGEVTLDVLDGAGRVIRSFSSRDSTEQALPVRSGMNRIVWDLEYEGVSGERVSASGPVAVPGSYEVRLTAGGEAQTRSFELRKDPRIPATVADLQVQFDLLRDIRGRSQAISDALSAIDAVREQVTELSDRVEMDAADDDGTIQERAQALLDALETIEGQLDRQPDGRKMGYSRPRLLQEYGRLDDIVRSTDAAPTDQSIARYEDLAELLGEQLSAFEAVWEGELAAFNDAVREAGVPAVIVPAQPRGVAAAR